MHQELKTFFLLLPDDRGKYSIGIDFFGIAQALFLCFYLIGLKKGNKTANIFLALMLLGLTIRIGKSILNVYLDLTPWQRNLGISGILIVGPFLWFYGRMLLEKEKKGNIKKHIHLVPFALFAIFSVIIPNNASPLAFIIYVLVFAHMGVYIALSFMLLFQNKNKVHAELFKWYRNLVIGVALIGLFYIFNVFGLIPLYIGGAIFFSFLIYTFSFLLLQRHDFILEKYSRSGLDISSSKELLESLKTVFDSEELFLDNSITLSSIAAKLGFSSRDISRAINENEGKNFFEFVNGYRIQKAKSLLIDTTYLNEKITTVAYDCGFGNVTSFNLAFKVETGLTPSRYRNEFKLGQ